MYAGDKRLAISQSVFGHVRWQLGAMGMVMKSKESNWRFFSFAQTHAGKVRPYNEDAYLECTVEGVWVVADGMGGHKAGDVASRMLVDTVQQFVKELPRESLGIDYMRKALDEANSRIFDYSQRYLQGETIGTTAVLLFVQDGRYHCLWVGDSRLYLQRNQQLVQKTRDHSQVMDMVEQGLIRAYETENHPMANVITRAIGVGPDIVIDQISGELVWGDQFLLCTDGLTKELPDAHMAHCMQSNIISDSGLALMHSALVRGASDNVTCVLVRATNTGGDNQQGTESDDTVPLFNYARQ
ncbi:serine/threonine-protein phosphatase [Photobacterium chitinilyticum]|uniref:Serine/threonine-protein phosphatase n=2 Tax=Photobacterium chitinilyticum TaxID=2485123 RepID=A0A444JVY2_9GAMM|nr:serine/threonine-protein phosphatase [Photobacterium chitinilyticum]